MVRTSWWTVLPALWLAGCVLARQEVTVRGRRVAVEPVSKSVTPGEGELLAVSPDSLWLAARDRVWGYARADVLRVRIQRTPFSSKDAVTWALIGAVVTGGAMTVACNSVEGADCGGVLPVVAGTWILGGVVSASSLGAIDLRIPAAQWDTLRAYARLPQGLPPGVVAADLIAPPRPAGSAAPPRAAPPGPRSP